MKLFSLFRIPVYLSPWTVIFWGVIAALLASHEATWSARLLGFVVFAGKIVLMFGFVLAHEYGHALMAKRRGYECPRIDLLPIGGCARINIPDAGWNELVVTLAGLAVSLSLVLLTLPILLIFRIPIQSALGQCLLYVGAINLALLIFNLLPLFPMDGGRVLRSVILLAFKRTQLQAMKWTFTVTVVVAPVMCVLFWYWKMPMASLLMLLVLFVGWKEFRRKKQEMEQQQLERAIEEIRTLFTQTEANTRMSVAEFLRR